MNTPAKTCLYCGKPMQSQRSTKKYCSDNCKQLAFYKRSGSALSAIPDNADDNDNDFTAANNPLTVKQPLNGNEIITTSIPHECDTKQLTSPLHAQTVNDKPPVIVKESFTIKPPGEEIPYQWIHSKLIDAIAAHEDKNGRALLMFLFPGDYWGVYTLPNAKWVSLRLRCLLENLIRLSQFTEIDYGSLLSIKEAFTALATSSQFKSLPANYPFTALAKELEQRLTLVAKEYKHSNVLRLQITLNRKAELIATRFMLAAFVPALKFSEMSFKD